MSSLHVVLVEPEIHWNTGNAGRTCLAVGAQLHLVEPLGFSLDAKEVRRSGLDYWDKVKPRVWPDWQAFALEIPHLGEPFLVTPEGSRSLWEVHFPERVVLVLGRESDGLPGALRDHYREAEVRIPMRDPELRSLNLSTCVGIAAYEVLRQWGLSRTGASGPAPGVRPRE
jgi:tRNA (cytidine/uridine-2'-O-)-methyltransferase